MSVMMMVGDDEIFDLIASACHIMFMLKARLLSIKQRDPHGSVTSPLD
jgi:hypothetical protein